MRLVIFGGVSLRRDEIHVVQRGVRTEIGSIDGSCRAVLVDVDVGELTTCLNRFGYRFTVEEPRREPVRRRIRTPRNPDDVEP